MIAACRRAWRLAALVVVLFAALAVLGPPARAFDPHEQRGRYVARTWGITEGLPVGVVLAIAQTPDGYLWLGTEEGLVRFDGVRFVVHTKRSDPGLHADYVRALDVDASGTLWIGTFDGGLSRYVAGRIEAVGAGTELASKDIRGLAHAGTVVYAATQSGELFRVEGDAVRAVAEVHGKVGSVLVDTDGSVWIGTDTEGIVHLTSAGPRVHANAGEGSRQVIALHRDRRGTLWAGTQEGVLERLEGERFVAAPSDGAPTASIGAFAEATDGALLLATQDGGLKRFDGERYEIYGPRDGLPNAKVFAVFVDREGSVWAGTLKGLVRMKLAAFATYGDEPLPFVWCVRERRDGAMMLGAQAGLEVHEKGGVTRFGFKQGLSTDEVAAIEETRDGALWVGSRLGLSVIKDGKVRPFAEKERIPRQSVYALLEDRKGTLWIGTYGGGAARYDGTTFEVIGAEHGMNVERVVAIFEGRDGTIWMGGDEGLSRGTNGRFEKVVTPGDGGVFSITEDDDGRLFFGLSGQGIGTFAGDAIAAVGPDQGQPNDIVYSVLDDRHGALWTSGNKGVVRVVKADVLAVARGERGRVDATSFGREDGMRSSECNGGGSQAGWRAKDGRLWFATTEGAAVVDPTNLPKNRSVPPVLLEELRVDKALLPTDGRIVLEPGRREFEIRYTAPSFVAPERVTFRYRLEGFDRDWVDAGARRVVYYTNLAPGEYRFRVTACNEDGACNDAGATLAFRLAPQLWETKTFYGLVAAALVLGGALAQRVRSRQLRLRAVELEARVEERTLDLRKAHAQLEEKDKRLGDDLRQARAFQRSLLPELPTSGPFRFAAVYVPAELVGGDLYDVCAVGPDRVRVFLADATGHGVQASLRTMVLKVEYDRQRLLAPSPAALLAALNEALCEAFPDLEMRASAVCFDVVRTGEGASLVYGNAGHVPMLLVHPSGAREEVYAPGPFLGMMPGVPFDDATFSLAPGARVLAHTDGLTEQDGADAVAFGDRALDAFVGARNEPLAAALDAVVAAMRAHAAGKDLADDVTLVGVEAP